MREDKSKTNKVSIFFSLSKSVTFIANLDGNFSKLLLFLLNGSENEAGMVQEDGKEMV